MNSSSTFAQSANRSNPSAYPPEESQLLMLSERDRTAGGSNEPDSLVKESGDGGDGTGVGSSAAATAAALELETTAKFETLEETVLTSFAETQMSVQELMLLKDELLMHFLPPPVLFRLAVVFGRVYRNFSDLNTPVFELLRLVRLFSSSWEKQAKLLKHAQDMYESKKQLLNIAIKRLATVDKNTKLFMREKRVQNWEKLFVKLSEAKGHGRRWRFQMEAFRQKASLGHIELLNWIDAEHKHRSQYQDESFNLQALKRLNKYKSRGGRGIGLGPGGRDRRRTIQRLDSDNEDDELVDQVDELSEDGFESGDDQAFKMSSEKIGIKSSADHSSQRFAAGAKEVTEVEVQTHPDVDQKLTWTGEADYRRQFVVRIFKPAEFGLKRVRFKIKYENSSFTSSYFEVADKRGKEMRRRSNLLKKRGSVISDVQMDAAPDEKMKINKKQYQDFIFETSDFYSRPANLSTKRDNCVVVEMNADDKESSRAYSYIQIDDVHTLDLPILYYKEKSNLEVVDYYTVASTSQLQSYDTFEEAQSLIKVDELAAECTEIYKMMANRTPFTFDMTGAPMERRASIVGTPICKLPLLFFWIRVPSAKYKDKNTGTMSIRDLVTSMAQEDTSIDVDAIEQRLERQTRSKSPTGVSRVDKFTSPFSELYKHGKSPAPPSSPTLSSQPPHSAIASVNNDAHVDEATMTSAVATAAAADGSSSPPGERDETAAVSEAEVQAMKANYEENIDQLKLEIFRLESELARLNTLREFESPHGYDIFRRKSTMKAIERVMVKQQQHQHQQPMSSDPMHMKKTLVRSSDQSKWTRDIPKDFFDRLKSFSEKSNENHKRIIDKYLKEEATKIEQQMAVQHRLDVPPADSNKTNDALDEFCLPAVFMPFRSNNNVFNPRAHQYFHPLGYSEIRLTQPPSVFQLPPLPKKLAVINLFDLGKRYESGELDFNIRKYIDASYNQMNDDDTSTQKNTKTARTDINTEPENSNNNNNNNTKTNTANNKNDV